MFNGRGMQRGTLPGVCAMLSPEEWVKANLSKKMGQRLQAEGAVWIKSQVWHGNQYVQSNKFFLVEQMQEICGVRFKSCADR